MAPELVPAPAWMLILGGRVLGGRTLKLLLQSAGYSVRYLGETCLGKVGPPDPRAGSERQVPRGYPGAGRLQIHPSEDEDLGAVHRPPIGACWVAALLNLVVTYGGPGTAGMADLLDGPAVSQGSWGSRGPQQVREIVGGKGLD